jgi:aspartokinase
VSPLVLKFGGTSLATPARVRLAARRVSGHLLRGRKVVVVVSAAGGGTDRILRLLKAVTAWAVAPAGGVTNRVAREADRALATGQAHSGAVLAAALGAECHVVTDVAAVYDRDPRVDAGARRFAALTADELVALAESGSEVVHAGAARLARDAGVPLRIYSFRAPLSGHGGTTVRPSAEGSTVRTGGAPSGVGRDATESPNLGPESNFFGSDEGASSAVFPASTLSTAVRAPAGAGGGS